VQSLLHSDQGGPEPEDRKTVQTFAGHSSLQVTMDRYGHLFKSDDHKKAMDTIAAEMLVS
jgi:integrase